MSLAAPTDAVAHVSPRDSSHHSYDDPTISSVHCKLIVKPPSIAKGKPQVWIEDCSSNGTWVNAQRIGKGGSLPLSDKDQIGFLWQCPDNDTDER